MTARSGAAMVAGVIGWPIEHSLSPLMHETWIAALGLDAAYVPLAIAPEDFETAIYGLRACGFRGLNVTLPHKAAALSVADDVSETARAVGAANTLVFRPEGIFADNTDVAGFLAGLNHVGAVDTNISVMLGAGGASRAVLAGLLQRPGAEIRIVARDLSKAAAVADGVIGDRRRSVCLPWDQCHGALEGAGLVVNATSLGMHGAPPLEISLDSCPNNAVVYDLIYTPRDTMLLKRADALGLRTIGGVDMLIGQGRPAFEAFFGVSPPEGPDVAARIFNALEGRR